MTLMRHLMDSLFGSRKKRNQQTGAKASMLALHHDFPILFVLFIFTLPNIIILVC